MTREKMIERIARIICEHKTIDDCSCPEPQRVVCTAYNKARDILATIIPDGAVVLTREEQIEEIKREANNIYEAREQVRKDTAREILRPLLHLGKVYGCAGRKDIEEIAEKYGVEVE